MRELEHYMYSLQYITNKNNKSHNQGQTGKQGQQCSSLEKADHVATGSPLVGINRGRHGWGVGGYDRRRLATSWPKINRKGAKLPPGAATSTAVIVVAAMVVGGLKMKISARWRFWGNRHHQRTVAGAKNWPERWRQSRKLTAKLIGGNPKWWQR